VKIYLIFFNRSILSIIINILMNNLVRALIKVPKYFYIPER